MASLVAYSKIFIYSFLTTQIASLIIDKTSITVFAKYSDFADVFLSESAAELSKHTGINNHFVELING